MQNSDFIICPSSPKVKAFCKGQQQLLLPFLYAQKLDRLGESKAAAAAAFRAAAAAALSPCPKAAWAWRVLGGVPAGYGPPPRPWAQLSAVAPN